MQEYSMMNYKNKAKAINNRTYTDFYYRLMLLARSVFEWKNLPNGINERWVERFLYYHGCCMFYHDETLGYVFAKTAPFDSLNEYDEPTSLMPVFANYRGKKPVESFKQGKNCVLVRNNDIMLPTAPTIELFAMRLTDIQRAIDININAMKTPVLITGTEKQKLSLKKTYEQWNGFEPVIYGDKALDTTDIKALKVDAPVYFDKLQIQKNAFWNECMTFLGINNANMDKRERLVDDEVQANNEQIGLSASVMLKARKSACEQINEIFKTNIDVCIRESVREQIEPLKRELEGGGIDER